MGQPNQRSQTLRLLASMTNPVHWTEMLVSTLTALFGILLVYFISDWLLETYTALLIVASMGSSAVMLFAVPHGSMSQPWPLFGGHLISALAGVTVAIWVPSTMLATALAVSLAVGLMHLLRCIHPPGGATALASALGGTTVYGMGYGFVLAPVMLNVVILFCIAVLANYPFRWRRYPLALMGSLHQQTPAPERVSEEDLAHAMRELNVIVDVTAEELREIADRALAHAETADTDSDTGVVLDMGPRFINLRKDKGWVLHKALNPRHDRHQASRTLTLNLIRSRRPKD
ncbi:MAG: HPP family protein [Thioalkalivibrio sp.]